MPAPAVLRDVFRSLLERRGDDADTSITFEDGPGPISRLDVFVHRATDPAGVTTFVTVGMSAAVMPTAAGTESGRAELWLSRRGIVGPEDEHRIALQLANLAVYPWKTDRSVGWGQIVGLGRDFPTFPGCSAVFLAGPLLAGAPDWLDTCEGKVRVITVVPITAEERATAVTLPPMRFIGDLMEARDVSEAPGTP
jgi:hypothetical protein